MWIKKCASLLLTICFAVSVNVRLPQFLIPFPFPFQPNPGMLGLPDVTKCWSSVMNVPGCITKISQSIFMGQFKNVSRACWKAFLEAEAKCMPNLPFNPIFPPMLKEQCSRIAGQVPPLAK